MVVGPRKGGCALSAWVNVVHLDNGDIGKDLRVFGPYLHGCEEAEQAQAAIVEHMAAMGYTLGNDLSVQALEVEAGLGPLSPAGRYARLSEAQVRETALHGAGYR
jgi:hypothetical protein